MDQARAEQKSRFLANFAAEVITADFPELAKRIHIKSAVLSWRSRTLTILPEV